MIKIDDRVGSRELLRLVRRAGAKAVLQRLRFADFSFWGHGRTGRVRIGVERKTPAEIVAAITDTRFTGHQLPGLCRAYDTVLLVIDGIAYPDPKTGVWMASPGRPVGHTRQTHLYENVEKFLLTLALKAGVRVYRTANQVQTAMFLVAVYRWYQKPWANHKSAYVVDETKPDRALLDQRTLKRQVANQLTGLAWKRSLKADLYFPSIASMVMADQQLPAPTAAQRARGIAEWQRALKIAKGTATAAKLFDVCHRRSDVKGKGA